VRARARSHGRGAAALTVQSATAHGRDFGAVFGPDFDPHFWPRIWAQNRGRLSSVSKAVPFWGPEYGPKTGTTFSAILGQKMQCQCRLEVPPFLPKGRRRGRDIVAVVALSHLAGGCPRQDTFSDQSGRGLTANRPRTHEETCYSRQWPASMAKKTDAFEFREYRHDL
jgi:hypothetical protein